METTKGAESGNKELGKSNERRGKKIRRSKPVKNKLKSFTVYYMNIRDLKSKRASFEEIIKEVNPTVIAITEAWTDEDYKLEIEGYATPFRNNRNKDGGGIILAVRKELKNISIEVKRTTEYLESLWIVINNNKIKLRIGVVYFPQEQDQNLEEIYSILKEQVQESGKRDESIMIMGDFNCRVGMEIEGNEKRISKGGRKLIKFVEKERLKITNSLEICSGRVQVVGPKGRWSEGS